ncbi:TRAP transporter large permease [Mesobacillus harenae]|uniref:TRAP transporter large permease n=1 Tax=Mesobacillus harenae TaxID=2213203 RepID=UPI001580111C|nr:TRAP transporter large permease [Mesobacillus harenae]
MIVTLVIVAFILMLIGAPIYLALGTGALVALALFGSLPLDVVAQRIFAGLDEFSLMAIPFFIFAANIMASGGMADRIINLVQLMLGRIKGGLGLAAVVSSLFFGAVSGSSPATVASIGKPLYPRLIKQNYPEGFSAGLLVSAGALGIIIPPSVTMIIYGSVTGVSVGSLFMAGIGAGLFFALVLSMYVLIRTRSFKDIPISEKLSFGEKFKIIKDASWGMGVPIIILGGIYGGVFTPTEAAGVSVIYALFVTVFVYRDLSVKELYNIVLDSSKVSAQVMIVIALASIVGWVITISGLSNDISQLVTGNTLTILIVINLIFLVGGMFLDGSSLIVILAPLLVPIGMNAGIDPVFLGILITVNCAIGMYTPPFGLNIFIASPIMKLSIEKISKAAIIYVMISILALVILILVPEISLWLPNYIYGK